MKLYVHKHIAFFVEDWKPIEAFMQKHKMENFTDLLRTAINFYMEHN